MNNFTKAFYRRLLIGEQFPSEYYYFDGLKWVHRVTSPFAGEVYDGLMPVDVCVKMSRIEIDAIPITDEFWSSLSPEEKLEYNTPALLAQYENLLLEEWAFVKAKWQRVYSRPLDARFPHRPYKQPTSWWLLVYPDNSALAYATEVDADYAAVGQVVRKVHVQESEDE